MIRYDLVRQYSKQQVKVFQLDLKGGSHGSGYFTYRAMMGEFIIYYRGKIVGDIYDDRLLVKPTKSAIAHMTDPVYEAPYEGAKEMLLVDKEVDPKEFLTGLFHAMYEELPMPKQKKKISIVRGKRNKAVYVHSGRDR